MWISIKLFKKILPRVLSSFPEYHWKNKGGGEEEAKKRKIGGRERGERKEEKKEELGIG